MTFKEDAQIFMDQYHDEIDDGADDYEIHRFVPAALNGPELPQDFFDTPPLPKSRRLSCDQKLPSGIVLNANPEEVAFHSFSSDAEPHPRFHKQIKPVKVATAATPAALAQAAAKTAATKKEISRISVVENALMRDCFQSRERLISLSGSISSNHSSVLDQSSVGCHMSSPVSSGNLALPWHGWLNPLVESIVHNSKSFDQWSN